MLKFVKTKFLRKTKFNTRRWRSNKPWLILVIVVLIVLGGGWGVRHWYFNNLRPVSSNTGLVYFTVSPGEGMKEIAVNLQHTGLIRSTLAFENYVRGGELQGRLQAGTYKFSQSMSVQQIVHAMVAGDVAKNLLTILPGKRLDQIKQAFTAAGYSRADIKKAFNPATYAGHPALNSLPAGVSLEGYLYPDSFQKDSNTPATTIIQQSLDEMYAHLTNDLVGSFGAQKTSVYQAITLASIVVQESGDPADQPIVAQVFLSRLHQGIVLGSDVTAFYASAIAGRSPSVYINSPYNTRLVKGLPPGPIGNVTASALEAVAHPAKTSYLYFVAGDDSILHFTYTQAEHEQAIQQYCSKACGL